MKIIEGKFGKEAKTEKGAVDVINSMMSLENIDAYEECIIIIRDKEDNMLSFASNMDIEGLIFVLEQVKLAVMLEEDEDME